MFYNLLSWLKIFFNLIFQARDRSQDEEAAAAQFPERRGPKWNSEFVQLFDGRR